MISFKLAAISSEDYFDTVLKKVPKYRLETDSKNRKKNYLFFKI